MVAAGKVAAGNLQVASIDVALVQSDTAVDCHLLVRAAAHGVIGTFHHHVTFRVGEAHGAVFRVVDRAAQMSAELYDTCVPKISPANGDLWKYNGQCTKWKFREPQARLTLSLRCCAVQSRSWVSTNLVAAYAAISFTHPRNLAK